MRLQTENRRTSQASLGIDVSRVALPIIGGQIFNKRASFTPLTGSGSSVPIGHRRLSSLSDSGLGLDQTYRDNVSSLPPLDRASRRHSGLSRPSPSNLDIDARSAELEALRTQLRSAEEELEQARRDLCDAKEAREASNTCVKALREFIEENNIGAPRESGSVKPATTTTEDLEPKKSGTGWAFKLWKAEPPVKNVPNIERSSTLPISTPTISPVTPLSRRFGEFFSSRTGVPSNSSANSAPSVSSGQEVYPGSDGSSISDSVPEPISPTSGDGGATGLIVRENVLSSPELYGKPELIDGKHNLAVEEIDLS